MKLYVLGFMFDADREKVLLVEKTSPPWQAGKLNGVGGKIEENEAPQAAMCREFLEETGINTSLDDWEGKLAMRSKDWIVYVYRAEGPIQLAKQITKKDKPICARINYLQNYTTIPNLRWIVPFLLDRENIQGEVNYHVFKEAGE